MKFIKIISGNIIEALITIGSAFVFIGLYMIFPPLAYIALGAIILLLSFVIYKNQ
jgi:hypothetical protein